MFSVDLRKKLICFSFSHYNGNTYFQKDLLFLIFKMPHAYKVLYLKYIIEIKMHLFIIILSYISIKFLSGKIPFEYSDMALFR